MMSPRRLKHLVALCVCLGMLPCWYMLAGQHDAVISSHRRLNQLLNVDRNLTLSMTGETETLKDSPRELGVVAGVDSNTTEGSHWDHFKSGKHRLEIPGIQYHLPQLRGNPAALTPALNVSQGRMGVKLVMGVPTVYRPKGSYLLQTLDSLISNLEPEEKQHVLIIVLIAEPWNDTLVQLTYSEIMSGHKASVESGLLDIFAAPAAFYPDMDALPLTLGDPLHRVKWRTKQNLDYAFLMLMAHTRGQYYIQLEDDLITKNGYSSFIIQAAETNTDWFSLKLSYLGFIGKLFHARDLPLLLEYLVMFHGTKPGDWLLDNLAVTLFCGGDWGETACKRTVQKRYRNIKPSQFQHIGYHSSLSGKVQKLKDKSFGEKDVGVGLGSIKSSRNNRQNPKPASIQCTMKKYKYYSFDGLYKGDNFFWAQDIKAGQHITINYDPPLHISRFEFRTGTSIHQTDRFKNTTVVEVLPGNVTYPDQGYNWKQVARFSMGGTADAKLPIDHPRVKALRIRVERDLDNWVIMGKCNIYTFAEDLKLKNTSTVVRHALLDKPVANRVRRLIKRGNSSQITNRSAASVNLTNLQQNIQSLADTV